MREQKYLKTAKRIKECLEESGMKATELADRIGVNRSAITHYTNGTSCPKHDTAQKIADVFGVDPLWIMDLSDEKIKERDKRLVAYFSKLSESNKEAILDMMQRLSEKEQK